MKQSMPKFVCPYRCAWPHHAPDTNPVGAMMEHSLGFQLCWCGDKMAAALKRFGCAVGENFALCSISGTTIVRA